jgi:hypothetical protein
MTVARSTAISSWHQARSRLKTRHYKGKPRVPARAIRVRTGTERAFMAIGPAAEAFLFPVPRARTS